MQVRFVLDKIRSSCVLLLAVGVSDDCEEQHEQFDSISVPCNLETSRSLQTAPCSLQTARGPFQWEFFLTRVIIRFLACNWGKQ